MAVTGLGLLAAALAWQSNASTWGHTVGGRCERQLAKRDSSIATTHGELEVSERRQLQLEGLLTTPASEGFVSSRSALDLEIKYAEGKRHRLRGLEFDADKSAPFGEMPLYLGSALSSLLFTFWILGDPNQAFAKKEALFSRFPRVAGLIALGLWAPAVACEIFASALVINKSWFGWDSFCVSPASFVYTKVALLGTDIVGAVPLAIFWCLFRAEHRPAIALKDRTAAKMVSAYVEFLSRWMFWGLAIVALMLIAWIEFALSSVAPGTFSTLYVGMCAGIVAVVWMLLQRVLRNIDALRAEYAEKVQESPKPPDGHPRTPDPTQRLFSDGPWRMPAAVVTVATIAMFVADKLHWSAAILGE